MRRRAYPHRSGRLNNGFVPRRAPFGDQRSLGPWFAGWLAVFCRDGCAVHGPQGVPSLDGRRGAASSAYPLAASPAREQHTGASGGRLYQELAQKLEVPPSRPHTTRR